MVNITEMIFIGRGGQGVWTAARFIAETLVRAGKYVMVMPEFKPERSGAEVKAYVRYSDAQIRKRYKIDEEVEYVVMLDTSLITPTRAQILLRNESYLVIDGVHWPVSQKYSVVAVDALKIARELKVFSSDGRPMGNMAVLGALLRILPETSIVVLEEIVRNKFGDASVKAVQRGYEESFIIPREQNTGQQSILDTDSMPNAFVDTKRPETAFAVSTRSADENKTGNWSPSKPVFDHNVCTQCGICEVFCPDDVIFYEDGIMQVEGDYCKGCGICVKECPHAAKGAIKMVEEGKK